MKKFLRKRFQLSEKYIALKNRISGIIKAIEFDSDSSKNNIFDAVKFYKSEYSKFNDPPINFLTYEEHNMLYNNEGKLNEPLYKVLLYLHASEAIKSGALNIKYSYKYLSIEDYLIPRSVWDIEKEIGVFLKHKYN